jgi:hypothetical protein
MPQIAPASFQPAVPSLGETEVAERVGHHGLDMDGGPGADEVSIPKSDGQASGFHDVSMNASLLRQLTEQQVEHLRCAQSTTALAASQTTSVHPASQQSANEANTGQLHHSQKTKSPSALFDMLGRIIAGYDRTAKGVIQSIRS